MNPDLMRSTRVDPTLQKCEFFRIGEKRLPFRMSRFAPFVHNRHLDPDLVMTPDRQGNLPFWRTRVTGYESVVNLSGRSLRKLGDQ